MGIIVAIGEVKTFKSGFKTRYVVIDNGSSSSPNPIKVDCRDTNVDIVGAMNVNDLIEVLYEVRGRKWEGKYFVNIEAQSIRKVGDAQPVIPEEDVIIPGRTLEEQDEWDRANAIKDVPF
jgi:hypothetical protein